MHGKLIVIEGLEGAGKTTAQQVIAQELTNYGIKKVIFVREPGGTPIAEQLRDLIKQPQSQEEMTAKAEVLILYAARIQLVENIIKPALARGEWIIADRHDLSTLAYQGGGRGIDSNFLLKLRQFVLGDFTPDLTFYLDIPPEIGLERAKKRGTLDRIEQESLAFFTRTRKRYLALIQGQPNIIMVDAAQCLETVTQQLKSALHHWFKTLE